MMMKTKILLVDDHPIFRQGLVKNIERIEEFEIVGEAGDGVQALDLIEKYLPAIIVADVSMPSMNGFEFIRKAQEKYPNLKFIILTMYKEKEYFNTAMDLGVQGYLLKECASIELIKCLRTVAAGEYYVTASLNSYLFERLSQHEKFKASQPSYTQLTQTERSILKLISENKTSKEIANLLHISFRTVQNHRNNICMKLGLEGYNKLLQYALQYKNLL